MVGSIDKKIYRYSKWLTVLIRRWCSIEIQVFKMVDSIDKQMV